MPGVDEDIDPDEVCLLHIAAPPSHNVLPLHDRFRIGEEWVEGVPYRYPEMKYMMVSRDRVVSITVMDKEDFEAMDDAPEKNPVPGQSGTPGFRRVL